MTGHVGKRREEDEWFDEGGETQQPLICVYIAAEASGVLGEVGTLGTRE